MRVRLAKAGNAGAAHEIDRARPLRENEGVAQRLVDAARARAEARETFGFSFAGEGVDGVEAARRISEEIQPFAFAPGVARKRFQAKQLYAIGKIGVGFIEDLVEDPSHCHDGGAGVER